MQVAFSPPDIREQDIQKVAEVLRSGWITTGPVTKEFERELAAFCDTGRAACLNSATAALELTLRLLGIGEGDEVITSAYTYTASASVICHVGAKPVLIDTAPGSFEMDYDRLVAAVSERTKAVIPVDIAGIPCDYKQLFAALLCMKYLFTPANEIQQILGRPAVITDAAHSLGAVYRGYTSGILGDFTCFSFHAVKNLTTGEGGAVTWREQPGIADDEIYRRYMLYSLHGQTKDALAKDRAGAWEYDIAEPLYKCNMTDVAAALGLSQLRRYDAMLARRHEIIEFYNKAFAGLPVTLPVHADALRKSSGHLYMLRLDGRDEGYRNAVITKMTERGVACNVHYKPLPLLSAYKRLGFRIGDYPNAFDQYRNEITLPLYSHMTDEQAGYVADCLKQILAEG
ncbi:MAG: DegT/DnrJ/EryC1/StrS family aminotransferase [Oscillospiraceae bacterium]|nr:DegT/DnrJ/EryC1/StrS family aminotransferase [Oscillospiraceae bacterium]